MDAFLRSRCAGEFDNVAGVGVHVVTISAGRTAVPAAVMCDDAVALRGEVEQLVVPVIARRRPAVVEDDGLGVVSDPSPCRDCLRRLW